MNQRVEYRGYTIVGAVLRGEHLAQVYRGDRRVAERFAGPSSAAAIDAAKAWVDATQHEAIARRRWADASSDQPFQVGTVEDYVDFFETADLPESHHLMLVGHAASPGRVLSAGELARRAGWDSFSPANLQYGLLGARIAAALDLRLPRNRDGKVVSTCAIATSADPDWREVDGNFRWLMHEEVAEALRRCNMLAAPSRSR